MIDSSIDDNIQVAAEDLQALNLTSVYLKDGQGEVASLGVYHALHCLVFIPITDTGSKANDS